jgi:hypothetical protein
MRPAPHDMRPNNSKSRRAYRGFFLAASPTRHAAFIR